MLALAALATLSALSAGCGAPAPAAEIEIEVALDADAPPAPWALTAGDGSGLQLVRVDARGVLEGPLAFTELHLHFHNPEPRTREGTFAIALPPGASIARFAMETEAGFLEAEVVGTSLGRRAYEDILHQRRDPALLERAAAGLFTARVFPIPPSADKHLVISYAQELASGAYVLPLRGLPPTPSIDIRVEALRQDGAREAHELHRRGWRPDRDFTVAAAGPAAVTAGALVAAAVPLADAPAATDAPAALTLLVDTSGSRAPDFARYARSVRQLVEALPARYGPSFEIEVIAFDQEVRPIYTGPAAGYDDAHHGALVERGAAGASDLGAALAWLLRSPPHARVALVTDGVVTAGPELPELTARLAQLRDRHRLERLDVVLAGEARDEALAGALAHGGLPRTGAVLDLDRGAADVAQGLGEAALADVELDIPGAAWVSPRVVSAVRPGQPVMVYARLAEPARTIELAAGRARRTIELAPAAPPLLERAIARAEIEDGERALAAAPAGEVAEKLRRELEQRAVAARIVSSQTAMLVLESDADYARYGIDRRAAAGIVAVGPRGIEVLRAREVPPPVLARAPAVPVTETIRDALRALAPPVALPRLADEEGGTPMELAEGHLAIRADALPALAREEAREEAIEVARTSGVLGSAAVGAGLAAAPHLAAFGPDGDGMPAAWIGRFAEVMRALAAGHPDEALALARQWHARAPGDVLALIAVGEALEALGRYDAAARSYGSILDLYPGRADLRRFAGERLERAAARGAAGALALAIDSYRRAVADRPDQVTGHRLLAYALLRAGDPAAAFDAILAGFDRNQRGDGTERMLREDAGMIAAAYLADGGRLGSIRDALRLRHIPIPTQPSTRFVLYWETDANDVDLHVQDALGGHAFFAARALASGGELYADITTGYGPECFAVDGPPAAAPYRLSVHYFAQGPMGFGMGTVQIQRFDGRGRIQLEDRPYVIMSNDARVDLGEYAELGTKPR